MQESWDNLQEGTAVAISDGSLKDGHGSSRWKIAVATGVLDLIEIQKIAVPKDGAVEEYASTHCELHKRYHQVANGSGTE